MKEKNKTIRLISAAIAAITAFGISSCGKAAGDTSSQDESQTVTMSAGDEETAAQDTRFIGVDYGGREFRVQSSIDETNATNANELIEGLGEENGDVINDTVFRRNMKVEELLNIKLVFSHADYTFRNADQEIRKTVMSGDDLYDLIINDCRSLVLISDENILYNIHGTENFDLSRSYWYNDSMNDLVLVPGHMYLMAGDYFMDVLRSCHCLFYNKQISDNFYGDPEHLSNIVTDGGWTYDTATAVIHENYIDLNGDGVAAEGDQFGMAAHDYWGNLIAFVGSAGINFVDRTGDTPVIDFNNNYSVEFLEKLNRLYHDPGTLVGVNVAVDDDNSQALRNLFGAGQALIVVYQRLNDLSKMRDFSFDIGPIPYPKVSESSKYYTSIHDTTEMGAIPNTCTDIDFVSTCIEVLSRETAESVLPAYYEVGLKVKYSTDENAARMIDLIHDNFGSSFVMAYNIALGDFMLKAFTTRVEANSTDFVSNYEKGLPAAQGYLDDMIEAILASD